MSGWPIVGRDTEIELALDTMNSGSEFRGVVLTGDTGVGKTVLAHTLAASLESTGLTPRFVLGTQTGQPIPLGAFQLLAPVSEARTPAVMLFAAYRAISQMSDLVVVVDDAQWLDRLSAILISQLAVDSSVRLIVTVGPSDEPATDAIRALWKERQLLHLALGPFTPHQTDMLAHTVLGGPVDDPTVDRLHALTAGNPMLLRALITSGLEDRVLVEQDGRWRIVGKFRTGPDLDDLVQRRIASLDCDELDCIELIAAAEVLDWDILRKLCSAEAIIHLERRDLIQITDDEAQTLVQLAHPVLGEVLLRRTGVARARQLNGRLVQQISQFIKEGPGRSDVRRQMQLAQFMLNSDGQPDLDLILRAAAGAITMLNLALGERLARFAYDREGDPNAATVLGLALSWQGRFDEAEDLMNGLAPDGIGERATANLMCVRAMNLYFGCGRVAEAWEILSTARDLVNREARDLVRAMEVSFALFGDDVSGAVTSGLAALESGMMPLAAVQTATAAGCGLALSGRYAEVPPVAGHGYRAAEQCECGLQRFLVGFPELLMVTATGDLDAADQFCARYSVMAAGAPVAGAIVNAFIGRVQYLRGRLSEACLALQSALSTLSESFPIAWVMLVAAWCAQAEAARGSTEAAAKALAEAQHAAGPQVAVFLPDLELARAWVCACGGMSVSARTHALRAAAIARRSGMDSAEMEALHVAVRFGDRAQAGRLGDLKRKLATPLAAAIDTHAVGLARRDGRILDGAASQFEAIGAMAMAADAAAHAAGEHSRTGSRLEELGAAARAQSLAEQCALRSPATVPMINPLSLTDREREVADLVAAGLTNRQIAERLGVSARTIDGHLYRIFAKLGIDDRSHLTRLVRISSCGSG